MDSSNHWSRQQIGLLIDCVEKYPYLYDTKNTLYHNREVRQDALEKIVFVLAEVRPQTTVAEVKKKWNGLRSAFTHDLVKKPPKGCSGELVPRVWYFQKLLFLKDHIKSRRDFSSVQTSYMSSEESQLTFCDNDETDETKYVAELSPDEEYPTHTHSNSSYTQFTSTQQHRKKPYTRTKTNRPEDNSFHQTESMSEGIMEPNLEDDILGRFIASQFKTFKNPTIKKDLKYKILLSIIEAQKRDDMNQ